MNPLVLIGAGALLGYLLRGQGGGPATTISPSFRTYIAALQPWNLAELSKYGQSIAAPNYGMTAAQAQQLQSLGYNWKILSGRV